MAHRNPSRRERVAAAAYARQHNVSYQTALRHIRGQFGNGRAGNGDPLDVHDRVQQLLENGLDDELRELIQDKVNAHGIVMDEFTPESLVEGDIEEATLSAFVPGPALTLEDAYVESSPSEPTRYGIHVTVDGDGDVDWYVSAPTAGDVDAFGDRVEGYEDGGGLLQDVDGTVPVRISAYVEFAPGGHKWSDVQVDYVAMPREEVERRARIHSDEEFTRLQALGLMPDDDEIQKMADEHEAAAVPSHDPDNSWPWPPRSKPTN